MELPQRVYWRYVLARSFRPGIDILDTFGRAIYAEFLLRDVQGMPDPGPRWDPKSKNPASTLPKGYGKEFAKRAFDLVLKRVGDRFAAEDVVMDFLLRFIVKGGADNFRYGTSLPQAENYVVVAVVNQAKNYVQEHEKDEELQSLRKLDRNIDLDEDAEYLRSVLPPSALEPLIRRLNDKVHPDAGLYFKLLLQGYDKVEITGNPPKSKGMLPHYNQTAWNWQKYIEPEIEQEIRHFLSDSV